MNYYQMRQMQGMPGMPTEMQGMQGMQGMPGMPTEMPGMPGFPSQMQGGTPGVPGVPGMPSEMQDMQGVPTQMQGQFPGYQPTQMPGQPSQGQFPQYPQSEQWAGQMAKQPLYPELKQSTLNLVMPFVNYGLQEGQATNFRHAMMEVAAMAYLIGRGLDPQTAYLIVESWEVNETF